MKIGDLVGPAEKFHEPRLASLCGIVCNIGSRRVGHYIMVRWSDGHELWHRREHLILLNKK